jgi:hypothetical protein
MFISFRLRGVLVDLDSFQPALARHWEALHQARLDLIIVTCKFSKIFIYAMQYSHVEMIFVRCGQLVLGEFC